MNLYFNIKREFSPEEKQHMFLLQNEEVNVIEIDNTFSFQDNDLCNYGDILNGVNQGKICISDDYDILRQAYNAGWAVIVYLDELSKTQEKMKDCAFVRYATDSLSAIDRTYLYMVYCHCKGIPRLITQTKRLIIKEMMLSDIDDLTEIFESNEKTDFFEPFYSSRDEAEEYLNVYINNVYCFYDYGIWGVYLKETGKMIGIAGFTPRQGDEEKPVLELGYAVAKLYQGQGYAKEACKAVVAYAQKELEYEEIIEVTSKGVINCENTFCYLLQSNAWSQSFDDSIDERSQREI